MIWFMKKNLHLIETNCNLKQFVFRLLMWCNPSKNEKIKAVEEKREITNLREKKSKMAEEHSNYKYSEDGRTHNGHAEPYCDNLSGHLRLVLRIFKWIIITDESLLLSWIIIIIITQR